VNVTSKLDEVLPTADVVMTLRMQTERQSTFQVPSMKEYTSRFGITEDRLAKIQKHAIILHPGPVNRGIELMSAVMDDPRCKVLEQVNNGVLIRAVLMSEILGVPRGKAL
jgi:aspartate carbamoyltransferase catalytic subunit